MATAGAGLLGLTSIMHAAFAYGETTPDNTATNPDIGLVMGGSGTPIPGSTYVTDANDLFIANPLAPNFPDTTYPGVLADGLFTPEGLYPSSGVNSLPLETSLSQGVTILN
ncbi:MAG: PE-PPE domain-containing protein, partial [Mycobacterium sp.]